MYNSTDFLKQPTTSHLQRQTPINLSELNAHAICSSVIIDDAKMDSTLIFMIAEALEHAKVNQNKI